MLAANGDDYRPLGILVNGIDFASVRGRPRYSSGFNQTPPTSPLSTNSTSPISRGRHARPPAADARTKSPPSPPAIDLTRVPVQIRDNAPLGGYDTIDWSDFTEQGSIALGACRFGAGRPTNLTVGAGNRYRPANAGSAGMPCSSIWERG